MAIMCGVCVVNAVEIQGVQEDWCGDAKISHCINHFKKQCDSKDYDACGVVGWLQYEQKQYGEAKKYYEMTCEKAVSKDIAKIANLEGNTTEIHRRSSCRLLGFLYRDGQGARQDYGKAMQYYKKACDLDDGNGCMQMGILYYNGQGVQRDLNRARELSDKSCKLNYEYGCIMLGSIYHNGDGVQKDLSKAKEYYGKACDMGAQMGCDKYKMLNIWK